MKAAGLALADPSRMALGERAAGLGGRLVPRLARREAPGGRPVLSGLLGLGASWTRARDLPIPPRESFRRWWSRTDGGRR